MKTFKKILLVVATTSILGVATSTFAGESKEVEEPASHHHFKGDDGAGDAHSTHGPRDHGFREHGRLPVKLLNLSDSQKQILEASRAERRPAMKETHKNLRTAREALDKAGDQNADDATLNKLAADLASLMAQQEVNRIKARRDFLSILTSEQKQKLEAFEAEHKGPARWRDKVKDRQKNTSSTSTTKS